MNARRGHGAHVLALRRRTRRETVASIGIGHSLSAARANHAGQRHDLDDVGSTPHHQGRGQDDRGACNPASLPAGIPRSSSTTSPGVSIEPSRLSLTELVGEVTRHGVLAERADGVARRLIPPLRYRQQVESEIRRRRRPTSGITARLRVRLAGCTPDHQASVPRAGSRPCRRGFRPGPVAATGGRSPVPGCWCGGTARCPRRRWPGPRRRCPRPTTRRPVRR